MKAIVQLHNGDERTYEQVDRVAEKDEYSIYIYGEDNRILGILNKGDIKNLHTEEIPE